MSSPQPGSDAWLAQINEDVIDPEREIIDPHHHLWKKRLGGDYLLEELWTDTGSGHNIVKTVFMECRAFYHRQGLDHLQSLGETAYITELAKESQQNTAGNAAIAGIVAQVDLRLAGESSELLIEVLNKHRSASEGLLRGIRHAGAYDKRPQDLFIVSSAPPDLYSQKSFRQGLKVLAGQDLSYDTWHYHHQNRDYLDLAQAVPDTTMVLDHFGTPLGIGIYADRREEIFQQWKKDIAEIARCENVYAKLGGLAMPDNGFGWNHARRPPDSDEFVKVQKKYYLHAIECFGPRRCMFESNFPVDRLSINYRSLWNGYKKMVEDFNKEEKHAMFYGTAARIYKL